MEVSGVDVSVEVGKIVCVVNADSPLPGTQTITDPVTVCSFFASETEFVKDAVVAGNVIRAEDDVVVGVVIVGVTVADGVD